LTLLTYFGNQDIWYELLHAGADADAARPTWFIGLTSNVFAFEGTIRTLVEYCLVEAHSNTGSYSIHVCVHDWTLNYLNRDGDAPQYWLAFDCVAGCISGDEWENLFWLEFRRLTAHTTRLAHDRLATIAKQDSEWVGPRLNEMDIVARLLGEQHQYSSVERMYQRALAVYEKALGPDHDLTLTKVHNLGHLHSDQGKIMEAEQMYQRALVGRKKASGQYHKATLETVRGFSLTLYRRSFQTKSQSESPKHQVFDFTKIVRNWGNPILYLFGMLGRILLWNGDGRNAQIAFRQQIILQDGSSVYFDIGCDGCNRLPLTCAMKRFVCDQCEDIDLWGLCLRKLKSDATVWPTCQVHSFFEILPRVLSGSNSALSFGEPGRELWLDNLLRRYPDPEHAEKQS
jgi:tetratricopeptide (TPR) repeat protein